VADLVVGVVGDVLRHVAVKVLKRSDVSGVAAIDAAELVVLLPEIGLDDLRCGEKLQDRNIAAREPAPGIAPAARTPALTPVASRAPAGSIAVAMPTPLRNERRRITLRQWDSAVDARSSWFMFAP